METTAAPERHVLLLLLGDVSPGRLQEELGAAGHVHVVAPALLEPLDWLATADDAARRQAEVRALEAEWVLSADVDVGGEAGDVDPVQAAEDALRSFEADEIVIGGDRCDPDLEAALARLGLPIRRLAGPLPPRRPRAYRLLRGLAAGRRGETPFALFVGVNAALLLLGLALSLVVLLVVWLVGGL